LIHGEKTFYSQKQETASADTGLIVGCIIAGLVVLLVAGMAAKRLSARRRRNARGKIIQRDFLQKLLYFLTFLECIICTKSSFWQPLFFCLP
jgi:Ca2+/Na+ antiporter